MGVDLKKGDRISLAKDDGGLLTNVTFGLGWDPVESGEEKKKSGFFSSMFGGGESTSSNGGEAIDLDASIGMFDASGSLEDKVWFSQKKSKDDNKSIRHSGDNTTGQGEGDDEQIRADLSAIPANIQSLVVVITSYTGQTFNQIANAFCRMVDDKTGEEVFNFNLSEKGNNTAMIMLSVYRSGNNWEARGIGQLTNGRTIENIESEMARYAA